MPFGEVYYVHMPLLYVYITKQERTALTTREVKTKNIHLNTTDRGLTLPIDINY